MIGTIFKVLLAMPKILQAAKELSIWLQKTFGENWPETIDKMHETMTKLNNAKNPEDRIEATRELHRFLQKL